MNQKETINLQNDWHSADIIAAIRKAGMSLAELSRRNGLHPRTLNNVLHRKWPKGERIIAECLNLSPDVIWPSRYLNQK